MSMAVSGSTDIAVEAAPPRRTVNRQAFGVGLLLAPGLVILAAGLLWPCLTILQVSLQDRFPDPTGCTLEHHPGILSDASYPAW